ncbi:hypothetical protein ACP70R_045873 [Stipagrostis hirtigluma subsp. patula]
MKKSVDLKTLWNRAAKTRRVESENVVVPFAEPVTIDSEAPNQSIPSVHQPGSPTNIAAASVVQPQVASNDPEVASVVQQQQRPPTPTEPSTWSPIRDGDDPEYESDGDGIYDIDFLSHDPGKRIPIKNYDVNERNSVIRAYIALGPCQPRSHNFPQRPIGGKPRRFVASWFDEFGWLEYSVELDAAFCFVCYLFKHKINCAED